MGRRITSTFIATAIFSSGVALAQHTLTVSEWFDNFASNEALARKQFTEAWAKQAKAGIAHYDQVGDHARAHCVATMKPSMAAVADHAFLGEAFDKNMPFERAVHDYLVDATSIPNQCGRDLNSEPVPNSR